MAIMIPDRISEDSSPGERDLFLRLKKSTDTEDWVVLHSLDVAKHRRQISGEIDMIVVVPGLGVLCLEVKACQRLSRNDRGDWFYGSNPKPDYRGPFKQASSAMHSLRNVFFSSGPLAKVVFFSGVIFTHVAFNQTSPEWHSWQFLDVHRYSAKPISELLRSMLGNARKHVATTPTCGWFDPNSKTPTPEQCKDIAARLRPSFEFFESPKSRSQRTKSEIKQFTDEQFVALDAMQDNPRVLYKGPAGTGKSVLAIEAVRRACLEGKTTLFLCYNKHLSRKLADEVAGLNPNVECSTLHSFMLKKTGKPAETNNNEFWSTTLPSLALEKLIESNPVKQFDYLVIDEVQDICTAPYLELLDCVLLGGLKEGRFAFFGDFEKQAIFAANSQEPQTVLRKFTGGLPQFSLRINCRNRPRLAALAHLLGQLNPNYSKVLRDDDQVECFPTYYQDDEDQIQKLVDALEQAYRDGFTGKSIVVLSPLSDRNCCASKILDPKWQQRLKPIGESEAGYIQFGSVQSFKGLEAEFVILTDIEAILDRRSQQIFYTGVTRALERLVILAKEKSKADVIRALTGTSHESY